MKKYTGIQKLSDNKFLNLFHLDALSYSGKKFDLLVIKDSTMMNKSKAKYALSKGIPILTRTEFINKYKG